LEKFDLGDVAVGVVRRLFNELAVAIEAAANAFSHSESSDLAQPPSKTTARSRVDNLAFVGGGVPLKTAFRQASDALTPTSSRPLVDGCSPEVP
jgi:hypothetical protein